MITGSDSTVQDVDVVGQWDNSLCESVCSDGSFEMGIKLITCPSSWSGVLHLTGISRVETANLAVLHYCSRLTFKI